MKVFKIVFALIFLFVNFSLVNSQEITSNSLSINMVDAVSPNKIDIYFSEAIESDSLRVSIENQTDKNFLDISEYKKSENIAWLSHIYLKSPLKESTAYKLTVNSVISTNGNTISEGIDAIRDFVTPARFVESEILNAPDNNTAVSVEPISEEIISTGEVIQSKNEIETIVENTNNSGSTNSPTPTDNLPSTWVETGIYILAILFVLSIIMVSAKRKA